MTLDKILKNYVLKPALALGLAYSLNGCEKAADNKTASKEEISTPSEVQTKFFSEFGLVQTNSYSTNDLTQIRTGDFDGDGDLDFIIGHKYGGIFIFENKIPQKNRPTQ